MDLPQKSFWKLREIEGYNMPKFYSKIFHFFAKIFQRCVLRETNMASRYEKEFLEVEKIGVGDFGTVYKCIKRLDGCVYAIKRSTKPLGGLSDE